jgi:hypothetical protein
MPKTADELRAMGFKERKPSGKGYTFAMPMGRPQAE